ncbi:16S rRNA (guanine(966)-N(2))-methyltransferase RsmD [Candidatus Magnetominusculus dajiuhuensis]|uniref:16S rRNA (guanine(966)-N(2))-methyltransferase RsmD n=1 Tax=Candidatus Magnetominusculus dajiuhuensis TaxID=3137712 RepID=UPI003B42ACB8
MKIIAGALKGKTVPVRHSKALRPTSAKVRESLFNIIRQRVVGSSFADLYAGSGAVGFEALSRGARRVVFVDIDRHVINAIERNPAFCNNPLNAAICGDAVGIVSESAPSSLRRRVSAPFDIVFADAPYDSGEVERLLPALQHSWILSEHNALVIVEHPSKKQAPGSSGSLIFLRTYRYGDTSLSVYKTSEDNNE